MSKTFAVRCVVFGCKLFHKTLYADLDFLKKHLRKHGYDELRNTAIKFGIIESTYFPSYDFLLDRIIDLCVIHEDFLT
ncbi:MAG: hypothetical protein ACYDAJ_04490 [Nitrosotalea sp.]